MSIKHDYNERLIRWQQVSINQFSYSVNLILSFAVASLGFCIHFLITGSFKFSCYGKCFFLFGTLLLLSSIGFGIWCVIARLQDFKKTKDKINLKKKRARMKEEKKENEPIYKALDNDILSIENETDKLGKVSWRLFMLQLFSFGVAILFIFVSMLIIFKGKLF